MTGRRISLLVGAALLVAVPSLAHAAIPFFGPIIPQELDFNVCPAGWGMLIPVLNRIIQFLITIAIVFVAPLSIAWAGFLYVVNPIDPGGMERAKGILWNTLLGILIALSGWLIVDALMAVLYHPSDGSGYAKRWYELVSTGGELPCLKQAGSLPGDQLNQAVFVTANSIQTGTARGTCPSGNSSCSVEALKAMAQSLNVPFSSSQADAMSCIAMTESSGNPNTPNSETGACGTFQITNKTSKSNWQNPAHHRSPCSTATSCNDAQCNLQTALIMFNAYGYQPWTGRKPDGTYWNPNAVACVGKYDPGSVKI